MKKYRIIILCSFFIKNAAAQGDEEKITKACINYIEGFYEGDTLKLIASLKPSLYKFGYYKDKNTGRYLPDGNMTYRQALDYAGGVLKNKRFAKADAPKKAELLNIGQSIATAKVTAWRGIDYLLLSKQNDQWMIEQALWEGPLQ